MLIFQLPRYSAYSSCTTKSPVLIFPLPSKVVLQSRQFSASSSPATPRTTVVLQSRQFSSSSSPASPRTKVVLQSHQFSSSNSPDTPRTKVVLQSRQFSSSHSPATPRTNVVLPSRQFSSSSSPSSVLKLYHKVHLSPAFRALDTPDLRSGLRAHRPHRAFACVSRARHARSPQRVARAQTQSHSRQHFAHSTRMISARGLRGQPVIRTLACISRIRHARSPQRVARAAGHSHSRLHFAHSTRTISAEGCARSRQIALSPAFRALDTHDLRRGLRAQPSNRTLACISRTRHARSPQRVARAAGHSHSRLHFAHSTRTISAEGCARSRQIALSPAFRALDTHDLRRGLRAQPSNRTLACISRTRHARSPQRVARAPGASHSRLYFAHSTRTISAEGCAGTRHIALSPAFRALDTHDLRRGLRAQPAHRTLACVSRTRHARSPQRVARAAGKSHSRLHFAHSTRTISAEGCIFG